MPTNAEGLERVAGDLERDAEWDEALRDSSTTPEEYRTKAARTAADYRAAASALREYTGLVEALKTLVAARDMKDAGGDVYAYQSLKSVGWHRARAALARLACEEPRP